MLFVLSGPSCVGKSFVVNYLTLHYQLNTVVPFTTRLPRLSESEGLHYHFRSVEELKRISNDFRNGYWAQPLQQEWYGYTTELDIASQSNAHHCLIQAATDIGRTLKEKNSNSRLIFLNFENESVMREKIGDRFSDPSELAERFEHARHEISNSKYYDAIIKDDDVLRILAKVRTFIEKEVGYLSPRMSEAGPLNDYQILQLIRSEQSGFRLESPTAKELATEISGWTIDLTLSPRFFVPTRMFSRRLRSIFDLSKSNAEDMRRLFKEHHVDAEKGFRLLANEFVLASTNEQLTLPANIAGLITGRSSYSRIGLSVELSQNVLQPGHSDVVALQIKNNLPFDIRIYPGTRIAQVALFRLAGPSRSPYTNKKKPKYLGSNNDLRSKFFDDEIYRELRAKAPIKSGIDLIIDLAQIGLGVASVLFGLATWIAASSTVSVTFAALTISATSLFVALLILKIFWIRR